MDLYTKYILGEIDLDDLLSAYFNALLPYLPNDPNRDWLTKHLRYKNQTLYLKQGNEKIVLSESFELVIPFCFLIYYLFTYWVKWKINFKCKLPDEELQDIVNLCASSSKTRTIFIRASS